MNTEQLRCMLQELVGNLQSVAGRLLGSSALEMKGFRRQLLGRAEKHLADARVQMASRDEARKVALRA